MVDDVFDVGVVLVGHFCDVAGAKGLALFALLFEGVATVTKLLLIENGSVRHINLEWVRRL